MAPQREDERRAIEASPTAKDHVLELDDLVAADATFVATGVTGGLLSAPRRDRVCLVTESIVIAAGTLQWIRQSIQTED